LQIKNVIEVTALSAFFFCACGCCCDKREEETFKTLAKHLCVASVKQQLEPEIDEENFKVFFPSRALQKKVFFESTKKMCQVT
jgi:hypothetical protein